MHTGSTALLVEIAKKDAEIQRLRDALEYISTYDGYGDRTEDYAHLVNHADSALKENL